ncbi:DNA-binding protein [Methylobacterium oryzae]|uniref:Protein of unassigned function n=1 Tax=Methylobacterium oryzae CBMB20 TaxID=693986 RepID=A0A089NYJ0_9HYPH|nr:DNA-binding protein [Methylobacterium oryzae]AIQ92447.1 protein of unassigned function [Methylobacterium oryzae CBMB20]
MVARKDVWAAADGIRARARDADGAKPRVSVRTVRKALGKGSFGDIARELAEWKARVGYRPLIEQAELPEALQGQLAAFGTALLEHVRVEQTRHRIAEAEGEAAREAGQGEVLEEALAQVDLLDARVAMLEAELARLRAAPPAPVFPAPDPEPEPVKVPAPMHLNPVYGKVRDRHTAEAADPVWAEVRVAVTRVLEQRGPMWVHAIHLSLPDRLKERAERAGLPLTPAWLRLHLIRLADAGDGFAEVEGRFAVAPPVEAAPDPGRVAIGTDAPPLSAEWFWKLFVAEVHDLLLERGPLTAERILEDLPDGWVAATERYKAIKPGRLRQKLRERIRNKRPLQELPGKVFAATGRWPGSRKFGPDEAA